MENEIVKINESIDTLFDFIKQAAKERRERIEDLKRRVEKLEKN